MKIAITTAGENLDAPVDSRFGRAPRFIIYNTEDGTFTLKENTQNLNAAQGAGIQSAMNIAKEQVDGVITGHCGPKAYTTLAAAGVAIYIGEGLTAADALEQVKNGTLKPSDAANAESHWI